MCALGVLVNPDLTVACAGGYLVQLLPGATEQEISRLEANVAALPGVTALLQEGLGPKQIMERVMAGFAPQVLDEHTVACLLYTSGRTPTRTSACISTARAAPSAPAWPFTTP